MPETSLGTDFLFLFLMLFLFPIIVLDAVTRLHSYHCQLLIFQPFLLKGYCFGLGYAVTLWLLPIASKMERIRVYP